MEITQLLCKQPQLMTIKEKNLL